LRNIKITVCTDSYCCFEKIFRSLLGKVGHCSTDSNIRSIAGYWCRLLVLFISNTISDC